MSTVQTVDGDRWVRVPHTDRYRLAATGIRLSPEDSLTLAELGARHGPLTEVK